MSIQNPYKVVAGFINTRYQNTYANQVSLGIRAVFNPNPRVAFVLIKVNTQPTCNLTKYLLFKTYLLTVYRIQIFILNAISSKVTRTHSSRCPVRLRRLPERKRPC